MARKTSYTNTLGTGTTATYSRTAKTNVRKQIKPNNPSATRRNLPIVGWQPSNNDSAQERRANLDSAQRTQVNDKLDKFTSARTNTGEVNTGHIRKDKSMREAKEQLKRLKAQNTDGRHDALIARAESALKAKADYRALAPG